MENEKILRFPVSFTKEDVEHCLNCIKLVDFFLDDETDGQPYEFNLDDIEFLERLLLRHYNAMRAVIEASRGSDDDL